MEAFLLHELGWIDPVQIDSTTGGGDTTIVLAAVPDTAGYAIVRTQVDDQYFFLELRNRDLNYALAEGPGGCKPFDGPVGLLVTHVARVFGFGSSGL
jgi:hypothetical protein